MEWPFIIMKYLNMAFWRFLIDHSMFVIFNDTGRTAFKFGRFEYFFVFLRPVFWEIPKWRYLKMLLYYSWLFVWYFKYFKCLLQHYDVIQQHCEVTQPHSSIPPAVIYHWKAEYKRFKKISLFSFQYHVWAEKFRLEDQTTSFPKNK